MAELRVVVAGAGGRMGRALTRAVLGESRMRLVGALDRADAEAQGQDAGLLAGAGAAGILRRRRSAAGLRRTPTSCSISPRRRRRSPIPSSPRRRASCTSSARPGSSAEHDERLKAAARHCRIVRSGNMSLGVNLLAGLVQRAAAVLGPEYDIEIVEMHHRHKVDAPSGTALASRPRRGGRTRHRSGRAVGAQSRRPYRCAARRRHRLRRLRGGSVVGDHTAVLAGEGERIELTHRAESRDIFARGALRAALWAFDKKPGLYDMADVLGLQ